MDPTINNINSAYAKPPDMLINVVLGTNDEIIYPMVAEIQVHLADINKLKHENHILYKVRRAENASELRQSTTPAPAPAPAPAPTPLAPGPAMSAATVVLPPLGPPLPSSSADALVAANVELKAQMARMAEELATQQRRAEENTARMANELATQQEVAETHQRAAEENAAQLQGMEDLLLEQAAELDALQSNNRTRA
jgi:hypothetical protein